MGSRTAVNARDDMIGGFFSSLLEAEVPPGCQAEQAERCLAIQ